MKRITFENWLQIDEAENEGLHPVDFDYEIIDEKNSSSEKHRSDNSEAAAGILIDNSTLNALS